MKPAVQRKTKDAVEKLPRKVGRPSIVWTEDLMTDICDHLSTGKSLIDISNLKGYPSSDSLYRQMSRDPDFADRIARARAIGQHHEADACVQMADAATSENWQVVKMRIWARQWRAGKLNPTYGDRLAHTGADGGAIKVEERRTIDTRNLAPEQREALRDILIAAAEEINADDDVIEGEFTAKEES